MREVYLLSQILWTRPAKDIDTLGARLASYQDHAEGEFIKLHTNA
jgi:hypothetical protein